MIYLITKPDFVLAHGAHGQGCVWRISQQANTPHPAPFPPALVNNCLAAIGTGPVLDPFVGNGTTSVLAEQRGTDWLGMYISASYLDTAAKRISAAKREEAHEKPRRTIRQGLNGSGLDDQGVQPPGKMTRKCAPLKKAPPKTLAPKNEQP